MVPLSVTRETGSRAGAAVAARVLCIARGARHSRGVEKDYDQ